MKLQEVKTPKSIEIPSCLWYVHVTQLLIGKRLIIKAVNEEIVQQILSANFPKLNHIVDIMSVEELANYAGDPYTKEILRGVSIPKFNKWVEVQWVEGENGGEYLQDFL